MKLLLSILFFLSLSSITAQGINNNLQLSLKVLVIDSNYYAIPCLKLLSDSQNIQIHKKLRFGNEVTRSVDCNFILQKRFGSIYANVYFNTTHEYIPNDDYYKLIFFRVTDSLRDTIDLRSNFPLEIGEYRIMLSFNFYLNGVEDQILSDWVYFIVDFAPRDPLFSHDKNSKNK